MYYNICGHQSSTDGRIKKKKKNFTVKEISQTVRIKKKNDKVIVFFFFRFLSVRTQSICFLVKNLSKQKIIFNFTVKSFQGIRKYYDLCINYGKLKIVGYQNSNFISYFLKPVV